MDYLSFKFRNLKTLVTGLRLTFKNLMWLATAFTLLLLILPLTRFFSYEFSVIEGGFLSFFGGLLFTKVRRQPLKNRLTGRWVVSQYLLLFIIPWVIQALKTIITCYPSLWHGSRFYFVITLPSLFAGLGIASCALLLSKKHSMRVFVLFYAIVALLPLLVLYCYKQIYFYNPLIGIFPGTVYDEYIPITMKLIYQQAGIVCISITLMVLQSAVYTLKTRRQSTILQAAMVSLLVWYVSPFSPFITTQREVERQLRGRIETQHFLIYFDASVLTGENAKHVGLMHEIYYDQLRQFYQTEPKEKIHSYMFYGPEKKYELLGTASADFSKPWKNEIYVNIESLDYTLKHELSHVFTAAFGYSPYKLAYHFNPAILEGAATASSPIYDEYPLHYLAFQAYKIDSTMDVAALFSGLNFFGGASSVSYCVSGSFSRYLIDTYGILKFREAYHDGFSKKVFGKSLSQLSKDYKVYLFSQGYTFNRELAEYFFGGPGLLQKTSPHYMAELELNAQDLIRSGRYEQALESLRGSDNGQYGISILKAKSLCKLKRYNEAIVLLCELRERYIKSGACHSIDLELADSYYESGDIEKAGSIYENLREHAPIYLLRSLYSAKKAVSGNREQESILLGDNYSEQLNLYAQLLKKNDSSELIPIFLYLSTSVDESYSGTRQTLNGWLQHQKTIDEYNVLCLLKFVLKNGDADLAQDILYKNDSKNIIFSPAISEERKKMHTMKLLLERGFQCSIWESHE
jgi:hypothetical protein